MSFDWQTEEKRGWDDERPLRPPTAVPPLPLKKRLRQRPWLLVAGVLLGLTAVAGFVIYRQIQQRLTAVNERTQAEILASYRLIQAAALNRDRDLFISFLSGRDPDWALGHEEAVAKSAFLDRPALGLVWLPPEEPTAVAVQNISPDLTAAEVVYDQDYAVDVGNGISQTIRLGHTDTYRLGPNRWLLAPPDPEFWGETLSHRGQYLTLSYPERDKISGRRLAIDLDEKLGEVCQRLDSLPCSANMLMKVTLSTESQSLTVNKNPDALAFNVDNLQLPTPSLVGVPLDEASYQALLRGYARQVIATFVAAGVRWDCCRHIHFYQALLDYELAQLGLQPWPLPTAVYHSLSQSRTPLVDASRFWEVDLGTRRPADMAPVYALVEFLHQDIPDLSLVTLQRHLVRFPSRDYSLWLLTAVNGRYATLEDLNRAYYAFLLAKGQPLAQPSPIPLPDQDLQLVCRRNSEANYHLYRYRLADNTLGQQRQRGEPRVFMTGLPDDSGVVVLEQSSAAGADPHTFIWQNGQELAIAHENLGDLLPLVPLHTDPDGNYLVFNVENFTSAPYALLPLAGCLNQQLCTATTLIGYPIWSLNGRRTLSILSPQIDFGRGRGLIFTGTADVAQLAYAHEGISPFWYDEQTFGYATDGRAIELQSVEEEQRRLLLTPLMLIERLPETERPSAGAVLIDFIAEFPADPTMLLIVMADSAGRSGNSHLFSYNKQTGDIALLRVLRSQRGDGPWLYRFSPNGRWLIIGRQTAIGGSVTQEGELFLYDMVNNQLQTLLESEEQPWPLPWHVDWSGDGRWLALAAGGYLRLVPLDGGGYERPLVIDGMSCGTAVWTNQ